MSNNLPRKYGGIGISLHNLGGYCSIMENEPAIIINGIKSKTYTIYAKHLATKLSVPEPSIEVTLKFPQHCGFGTGTQLRLAIIDLFDKLYSLKLSYRQQISLSQRGGASGIGIFARNNSGFIFDIGRPSQDDQSFLPTSNQTGYNDHVYLPALDFPWTVILAIPIKHIGLHGKDEVNAFKEICPISQSSSFEAGYEALFGAYASVQDCSYESLCKSLVSFQRGEWKVAVMKRNQPWVLNSKEQLEGVFDMPFFMSSWGPGLCGFLNNKISENDFNKFKIEFEKHNQYYSLLLIEPNELGSNSN